MLVLTTDNWAAIAALSQAAAATATFFAVFITVRHFQTLWKPRAKVAIDETIVGNQLGAPIQYVSLTVTNIGVARICLTGIQYNPGMRNKMRWFHIYDHQIPFTSKLPITLEATESAQYWWTPEDWDAAISTPVGEKIEKSLLFKLFWSRSIRVEINTSTGVTFSAKLSPNLIRRLENSLSQKLR